MMKDHFPTGAKHVRGMCALDFNTTEGGRYLEMNKMTKRKVLFCVGRISPASPIFNQEFTTTRGFTPRRTRFWRDFTCFNEVNTYIEIAGRRECVVFPTTEHRTRTGMITSWPDGKDYRITDSLSGGYPKSSLRFSKFCLPTV